MKHKIDYLNIKVTQKDVTSFNLKRKPSYNENANKAKGIHSLEQHGLFLEVQSRDSGVLERPISLKKVKDYLIWKNRHEVRK